MPYQLAQLKKSRSYTLASYCALFLIIFGVLTNRILISSTLAERQPETIKGKVVGISDGDTIELLISGGTVRIRLHGVDCPESGQAFGKQAKQVTSDLVFGKNVKVEIVTREKYNRLVGVVLFDNERNLSRELIQNGMAWWYQKYSPGEVEFGKLQELAKEGKVGLWSDPNPIPPWQYRRTGDLNNEDLSKMPEFFGNKKSHIFHAKGCSGYLKIASQNRVPFSEENDAIRAGFRPAKNCELLSAKIKR